MSSKSPKRAASKSPKKSGSKSPKKTRGRKRSPPKQVSPHTAHTHEELRAMKVRELREYLLKKGLPVSGNKEELVERLKSGTYKPSSARKAKKSPGRKKSPGKKRSPGRPRKQRSPGRPAKKKSPGRPRKAAAGGRTRFIYTAEGLGKRTKAELSSLARRFDVAPDGKSKEELAKAILLEHGNGKRARRAGLRRKRVAA